MIIYDQFGTIQNLQRALFPKPVTGQELFLAVSYSESALVTEGYIKLKQSKNIMEQKQFGKILNKIINTFLVWGSYPE